MYFSVDFSVPSYQPIGISQQPFSSDGGMQRPRGVGLGSTSAPGVGVGHLSAQPSSARQRGLDAGEGVEMGR